MNNNEKQDPTAAVPDLIGPIVRPPIVVPNMPPLGAVDRGVPIALFPLRLETRFEGNTIKVRAFPDEAQIDSHEEALSADELAAGTAYAKADWNAGSDADARCAAWSALCAQLGDTRAAYVAQLLQPTNPNDRPSASVTAGQPAPKALQLPALTTRPAGFSRAPLARALPDRLFAAAYRGGARVATGWGEPIADGVACGPAPNAAPSGDGKETLAVDPGMKWMVDFSEAKRVGLGFTITLPDGNGVDQLIVYGVRAAMSPDAAAARLADLFDAHHFTRGAALLPQGTPTHNTQAASAGFTAKPVNHDASYAVERGAALCASDDGHDGARLARALGIDAARLAHVSGSNGRDELDARAAHVALWPATWGYFLSQMMSPMYSDDAVRLGRGHFVSWVRARGPFAAVRFGRQPYGILPVTSLASWKPGSSPGPGANLVGFLGRLRAAWMQAEARAPHLGRTGDPDQDLVDVLRQSGASLSYAIRHVAGADYLMSIGDLFGGLESIWSRILRQFGSAQLTSYGLSGLPLLAEAGFDAAATALALPRVLAGALSEWNALPDTGNFVRWVRTAPLSDLRDENWTGPTSSLLYKLLRHARLLASVAAGFAIDGQPPWKEVQLIGLTKTALPATWALAAKAPVSPPGTKPVAAMMKEQPIGDGPGATGKPIISLPVSSTGSLPPDHPPPHDPAAVLEVRDLLKALRQLETRPTAALDRLLSEVLDLGAHRLDAWVTSFATQRLDELRTARKTGVTIGVYGFVENLQRAPARKAVTPPAGEEGAPLWSADDDSGFVQAPSLQQAVTSAVLRSGWLSHGGAQADNPMALDLSSARVRVARWLLAGLRAGQPLGALLGYRFERALSEAKPTLDEYVAPFRALAPLVAQKTAATQAPTGTPVTSLAASDVVDGLALDRLVKAKALPWGEQQLPAVGSADYVALQNALAVMEDTVDAVSDLLIGESVHHLVQGSSQRSAATLDALAGGEVPPIDPEFTRTPRTGIGVAHRLAVVFSGDAAASDWPTDAHQQRALVEPQLDWWAGLLLGDPKKIRCRATAGTKMQEIALADLALSPLDFVAIAGADDPSELTERVALRARTVGAIADGTPVAVDFSRNPAWTPDVIELTSAIECARSIDRLFSSARALDARELRPGDATGDGGLDGTDLGGRATSAHDAAMKLITALAAADADGLRGALLGAAAFGVTGAVPQMAGRDASALAALKAQSKVVSTALSAACSTCEAALARIDLSPVERAQAALASLFGRRFMVLPRFAAPTASLLSSPVPAESLAVPSDPMPQVSWLERVARVQPGAARLTDALGCAEALAGATRLTLSVYQAPLANGERWVGLDAPVSSGRTSLVVHAPRPLGAGTLSGLLVDQWTEVVPNARETTGVAFPFADPSSRAPQAILLAVSADPARDWDTDGLEAVLLETLALAKLRAVDPESLDGIGQYLPAAYFAVNAAGDTVTTNFAPPKGA